MPPLLLQAGSSCLQFGVRSYLHHFYEECSTSMWERDPENRGSIQSQRSALWWNSAVWKVNSLSSIQFSLNKGFQLFNALHCNMFSHKKCLKFSVDSTVNTKKNINVWQITVHDVNRFLNYEIYLFSFNFEVSPYVFISCQHLDHFN